MKAISLHQPWASLLVTRQPWHGEQRLKAGADVDSQAPMVKRFETRTWPCPPALIGQPIALASTQREPALLARVGEWSMYTSYYTGGLPQMRRLGSVVNGELAQDGRERGPIVDLPLGAVVGSGRITASYPIHDLTTTDFDDVPSIEVRTDNTLHLYPPGNESSMDVDSIDISDQLRYGDFKPGRYAWLIEDAAPSQERCPMCWSLRGRLAFTEHGLSAVFSDCAVCKNAGHCEPIPVKGAQRIWNWQS